MRNWLAFGSRSRRISSNVEGVTLPPGTSAGRRGADTRTRPRLRSGLSDVGERSASRRLKAALRETATGKGGNLPPSGERKPHLHLEHGAQAARSRSKTRCGWARSSLGASDGSPLSFARRRSAPSPRRHRGSNRSYTGNLHKFTKRSCLITFSRTPRTHRSEACVRYLPGRDAGRLRLPWRRALFLRTAS